MDATDFDTVVQTFSASGSRRGLLRFLTGLPLAGVLAAVLAPESEARRKPHRSRGHRHASHPRHHDTAHHQPTHAPKGKQAQAAGRRHRRKKKTPQCQPESAAQTCAGQCGKVTNTCGTAIDCGACSCGGCQICQTCDAATGQCVPNGSVVGQACASCHACTAAGQCAPVADGTSCDDGNACTQTDTCQGGVCVGTNPVTCTTPNVCHTSASATCDPTMGTCHYPTTVPNGTLCDDGICCNGTCCSGCCGADGTCGSGCRKADGTCGPCRVFVTSTTQTGNLGGLAGADAICQSLAANVAPTPLPGTYKAWLSDSTASPSTRFRCHATDCSQEGYALVDGTRIAGNWGELTGGTLAASIDITEQGSRIPPAFFIWTHTLVNGAAGRQVDEHCSNWTSASSTLAGDVGFETTKTSQWTEVGFAITCDDTLHLYCFQQD